MNAVRFKEKYIPYHQKMYRVAYRLLEDAQDAEDMVQEAYIKLWNKRNELNYIENEESYCIVLLRNLCLDFLRSKNKNIIESADNVVLADKDVITNDIESRETITQIEVIISQLPEQQQRVIRLRHFDDYSNEEIEQIMGLTNVNVRVLLSRARKKLKELFDNQNYHGI
ncbi:MAG: RNA polymerase sigma factor [Dysgonomonas sp.]|nr:RNA polymerase sigma factor [Dysgonomonas sp.]